MNARTGLAVLVTGTLLAAAPCLAQTTGTKLEKAIFAEQTKGDLTEAVRIYREILTDAKANRAHVARAQYRLGVCLRKQRKYSDAADAMQRVIADYPDQKALIREARAELERLRGRLGGKELAAAVRKRDDEVDAIHREMYDLVEQAIRENPHQIGQHIHLLSISRQLERIADHCVNIAEDVEYMARGDISRHGGIGGASAAEGEPA